MLVEIEVVPMAALDSYPAKRQVLEVVDLEEVESVLVLQAIRCSQDFQIFNYKILWAKMQKYLDRAVEPSKA